MRILVRHRHDLESLKLEVGTACAAFQGGTHSMAVFSLIRIKRAVSDSVYVTGCEFVMLWCRVSVCSVEHVPVGGYAAATGLPVSYLFFCPYIPVVIGGVHPCLGWRGRDVGPSYSSAFACASRVFRRQAVVLEQGRFDRLVLGELGFQKGKKAGRYGSCFQVCGNSDVVSGGLPLGPACGLGIGWVFTGDSVFVDERLRLLLFGVEALALPCSPSTSSTLGEPVDQFLQFTAVLLPWPENQGRLSVALHVHQPALDTRRQRRLSPNCATASDEHIRPWDTAEDNGVGRDVLTVEPLSSISATSVRQSR